MYIFELVTPGTRLQGMDDVMCMEIESIFHHIENAFYEANTSLNLFEEQMNSSPYHPCFDMEHFERENELRKAIETQICQENGLDPYRDSEELRFQTDVRFKKEKWNSGNIPKSLIHSLRFIYAKSFIYSLDTIEKFLNVLKDIEGAPAEIKNIYADIAVCFPDLKKVRNTTQHLEARSQGLGAGRNPQPMDLQPVDNGSIKVHAGNLVLSNLSGSKFGSTMDNGHFGEVDVSPDSLEYMRDIIQRVLNSFNWSGPRQHLPS